METDGNPEGSCVMTDSRLVALGERVNGMIGLSLKLGNFSSYV